MKIAPIQPPAQIAPPELAPAAAQTDPTDLGGAFASAFQEARGLDQDAVDKANAFAANDSSVGIHEVVIASEKANIALRYATTVKNKVLEAYHELMSTNV